MFETTLATSGAQGGTAGGIVMQVWLAVMFIVIAGMWRVFAKAGQPGWGVLVPIYNVYLMCKIAQRPAWWLILLFVPFVNIIVAVIMSVDIAKHFGKGPGFGIGLAFLGFIFYPILGFSGAEYGDSPMPMDPEPEQMTEMPIDDQDHEQEAA